MDTQRDQSKGKYAIEIQHPNRIEHLCYVVGTRAEVKANHLSRLQTRHAYTGRTVLMRWVGPAPDSGPSSSET